MFQKKKLFLLFLVVILTLSFSNLTFANSSIATNNIQAEEYKMDLSFANPITRKLDVIPIALTVNWETQTKTYVSMLNASPDIDIKRLLVSVYPCDKDGFIRDYRKYPYYEKTPV